MYTQVTCCMFVYVILFCEKKENKNRFTHVCNFKIKKKSFLYFSFSNAVNLVYTNENLFIISLLKIGLETDKL